MKILEKNRNKRRTKKDVNIMILWAIEEKQHRILLYLVVDQLYSVKTKFVSY